MGADGGIRIRFPSTPIPQRLKTAISAQLSHSIQKQIPQQPHLAPLEATADLGTDRKA